MSEKFDVVIAGGAIMGSSTAYHLAADPGFTGRVLVVEKDMTYAKSATALSLSSIRQQFSSSINIRVGLAGVAFLKAAKETLAVDGEGPDLPITENGYLYLASDAGAETLRANHAIQIAEGADVALLRYAAAFEATGRTDVMRQAVESARMGWGLCTIAGVAGKGETLDIVPRYLITGRRVCGSSFGGVKGRDQVPELVRLSLDGRLDVAPFISHTLTLDDVNRGFELMEAQDGIRSVISFG